MIFYLMSLFIIPSKRILAVYIRSAKKVIFKKTVFLFFNGMFIILRPHILRIIEIV